MKTKDDISISAIPTVYKGVQLKSRMEAQCAVLFDKLGWEWEYEPFSLILPSGLTFIPDFWIPERSTIIECRGYESERGDRQISEFADLFATDGLYNLDARQQAMRFCTIGPFGSYFARGQSPKPLILYANGYTGEWEFHASATSQAAYVIHACKGRILVNCTPLDSANQFASICQSAQRFRAACEAQSEDASGSENL